MTSQHGDHPQGNLHETPRHDLQDDAAQDLHHEDPCAGTYRGSVRVVTSSAYDHPRHPAWLRCWLYAMDHDGMDLRAGELKEACGLENRTLSRGLKQAKAMRLISEDSNARRLTVIHLPMTWGHSA